MPVTIHIPGGLHPLAGGANQVIMDLPGAATLRDALDALFARHPGLRDRVLTEQGEIREHVNLFVGNENSRYTGGLSTKLDQDSEITIVPAISGGRCSTGILACVDFFQQPHSV